MIWQNEEFDAIFVFGVLHHVPAWKEAIKEFSRVLKPGGVLLREDLNQDASKFFKQYFGLDHPTEAYSSGVNLQVILRIMDSKFCIKKE